uniref:HDC01059 n=1 Tax=Drosophila melanogaster TaxID=7227 RepID=Q6IHT6_DROME|nr:TPA_inf: HDC01059 [Drosophila melanogaster]
MTSCMCDFGLMPASIIGNSSEAAIGGGPPFPIWTARRIRRKKRAKGKVGEDGNLLYEPEESGKTLSDLEFLGDFHRAQVKCLGLGRSFTALSTHKLCKQFHRRANRVHKREALALLASTLTCNGVVRCTLHSIGFNRSSTFVPRVTRVAVAVAVRRLSLSLCPQSQSSSRDKKNRTPWPLATRSRINAVTHLRLNRLAANRQEIRQIRIRNPRSASAEIRIGQE